SVQRRSGGDPVPRLPGGAGPVETVPIREGTRIAFIFSLRTVSNVGDSVSVKKEKMLLHGLRKRSINGNIHVTIGDGGDSDSRISRCRGPFSLWRVVRRPQRASGGEGRGGAVPTVRRQPFEREGRRLGRVRAENRLRARLPGLFRQGRRQRGHPARRQHQTTPAPGDRNDERALGGLSPSQGRVNARGEGGMALT